jgi:transcriptional regulator with XRE-family HTH domain
LRATTTRRHIRPLGPIDGIGEEANKWEEQLHLGANPENQIVYGSAESELAAYYAEVRVPMQQVGVREVSRASRVSLGTVSPVRRGSARPSVSVLRAIDLAVEHRSPRPRSGTSTMDEEAT